MPVPHNVDNYTIPGGIRLFFNDGSGERDLGNVVGLDLEVSNETLEHKSNRSGKLIVDKILNVEDRISLRFRLDEPVVENLKYYFRGGGIDLQGAGSGIVTDRKIILSGTGFVSVGPYYGLSNVTVRQFLDYVLRYDGSVYHDHSLEADTPGGTAFTALADDSDYLYLGKRTKFQQAYFDLAVTGSYTGVAWQYWDGSNWSSLTVSGSGANLSADGPVTFTPPSDWAQTLVNGKQGYFIRVSASSVTTAATIYAIRQDGTVMVDYQLDPGRAAGNNRQDGRIARITTGIFADGEEVKVSFSYATWTALKMGLLTGNPIEGSARLEVQPAAGRGIGMDYIFPRALLRPNGNIPFDDTKWLEVPFELQVLDNSLNDPDYPLGYVLSYEV